MSGMDPQTDTQLRARARILKAMAHPVRLFIVEHLTEGESRVADLTRLIGLDVSTVSRHLGVLKAAGILTSRKQGAEVFYALRVPCILGFFDCIEAVLRSSAEEQVMCLRQVSPSMRRALAGSTAGRKAGRSGHKAGPRAGR